ncbi:MAG: hypothetical protein QOE35_3008 [Actinomycetota bacterium]
MTTVTGFGVPTGTGDLRFECVDAGPERFAAVPTLLFRLRITDTGDRHVHAMALRCQIRIEPQRRPYTEEEAERLLDLFGELTRWGETLKPLQFANVSVMVPGFSGSTEVDVHVPCTYDFEVSAAKYFHSLDDGEVPLLLLFSGTAFFKADAGFTIEQVPWHKEANHRLPVRVWRELMDLYFPNSAWIRLRKDTLDALQRYKSARAIPSWDEALDLLLTGAAGQGG